MAPPRPMFDSYFSWHQNLEKENLRMMAKRISQNYQESISQNKIIFPAQELFFNALELTPFDKAKVIILGQDPYHNENEAHGLAFSVPAGVALPPSLRNIIKELKNEYPDAKEFVQGDLSFWAKQGVLLLNSFLSVEKNCPNSHQQWGGEIMTDAIIETLSSHKKHCVFILWGASAQKKISLIDSSKHLILKSVHPSPLSAYRGFFGSKPFSKANAYLQENHQKIIHWLP